MTARSYLDHAASSPMPAEVRSAMLEAFGQAGNPSSLHQSGRMARRLLEEARESLAACVGARPDEVVFTSGGTEANNIAVLGALRPDRSELAISAVEHPSVAAVRTRLEHVRVLPVDADGRLETVRATELVGPGTALVSVMWVNNETGVIEPIADVVELAHSVGAWAHSDAVQAFGHVGVDFAASSLDLLTISAHKLGGPVGIGALVVGRGVTVRPSGFGGGQEARLRSGTLPAALAVGFAAAAQLAIAEQDDHRRRWAEFRDALICGVMASIEQVRVNSPVAASPAIVNLTFSGARADDVLLLLDAAGIDASTGSACTAGLHQPSDVLIAMGRTVAEAGSSLRFSFGPSTTASDIDRLLAVLPTAVARARTAA
jgi:cysteine desulfurase